MHLMQTERYETQHQENMSMKRARLQIPISYSKTLVYRDIPIFLIFDPKKYIVGIYSRGGSNVYPAGAL